MTDILTVGNTLVARPAGDLDVHTAPSFITSIDDRLGEPGVSNLLICMKKVSFIDSSGLGALLGRYQRISELGGHMVLAGAPARIRPILDLSGVLQVIPLFENEKKALEMLS